MPLLADISFRTALRDVYPKSSIHLVEYLGGGAFGSVYVVEVCGRQYVMKTSIYKGDVEPRSIAREDAIGRLLNHPGCDFLLASYRPSPGVVMFFRPIWSRGEDLTRFLDKKPQPTRALTLQILEDVAKGLEYMHSLHIAHLDIKPDNIIVRPPKSNESRPHGMLTDFGISCKVGGSPKCPSRAGTLRYMYPSPSITNPYLSDIYAFAAVIYRVLTGEPFLNNVKPKTDALKFFFEAKLTYASSPLTPGEADVFGWVIDVLKLRSAPSASEVVELLKASL